MATKTKPSKFKGKPLIEIPEDVLQANFLKGDFGKDVFEEYEGRVKADYKDVDALDVLRYDDGLVKGSNPFAVVLVNNIIRQKELRTATQADLERVLRHKTLNLRGTYEDSGLVLRSEEEPNFYLARNLAEQIRARNNKIRLPVMIPLAGLDLVKDTDSSYGLTFKLRDASEIIDASILSEDGYFSETDEKTGLPKKLEGKNRYSYIRQNGVSRLCLGRLLLLGSRDGGLAVSDAVGRVVVVSGEATEKNLDRYVNEFQKARKDYIARLQALREQINVEIKSN